MGNTIMPVTGFRISEPPKTFKEKIRWLGPGFLWMVSATGSGELLFTPRIGALYGYTLLWALLLAVTLKWFINREIGRYTLCTGKTVLDGFADFPGPKNWVIYLILVPQFFVAITSIAGLAGSAATAIITIFPGDARTWTVVSIVISTGLVIWGKFKIVEKIAITLAVLLGIASMIAAASVFPQIQKFTNGLLPEIPDNVKYEEILPWLGFILSGAAGLIWYSYWIQEKGYGVRKLMGNNSQELQLDDNEKAKLLKWIKQMTIDNTVAVVGTLIVTLSFLILGTEFLKPRGLLPEENRVAEVLGQLLVHAWGPVGFWFMIVAVFIGFWDTVLSDQDGFGRMFTGGTRLLLGKHIQLQKWLDEERLRKIFVIGLVTILPILMYVLLGEPVSLLKIAGAIEAAHIPIVVVLILYLNRKQLSKELQPSFITFICTAIAGIFFVVFAVVYVLQLKI